ncbi:amidohydrolase family protein [Arthrobacter sp. Bi26]|uniref:amidohydrolase family protein n=1 Tax=Arthrobacter sp. Bi26 TaxID=2822350 RepID=UPI0025B635EC|nr:amidohydrolase family protein [Arthrobacter sp. Bi26]
MVVASRADRLDRDLPANRIRDHGRVGALVRIDSDDHHGLVSFPSTGRDAGPRLGAERAAQAPKVAMRDILGYATIGGAKAIGQESEIGSLTPGKRADIQLIDTHALNLGPVQDPAASIVLAAHEGNVRHVLVGGKFVKRNGVLLGVNTEELMDEARRSQQGLLERAGRYKSMAGV